MSIILLRCGDCNPMGRFLYWILNYCFGVCYVDGLATEVYIQ